MSNHYLPALVTPGPGMRPLGVAPTPWGSLKLFKLANPTPASPAYPALPTPPCEKHNKGSCLCVAPPPSASLLTLVLLHIALHAPGPPASRQL